MTDQDTSLITIAPDTPTANDRFSSTGIFCLPSDIIAAIFKCGKNMVDYEWLEHYGEKRPHQKLAFERTVSQTCPQFREIALASANLWTLLQFRKGIPLIRTSECIKRSALCLLDIIIVDEPGYPMIDEAIEIVTRQSFRWRSLSLSCTYDDRDITTRICSFPAPALIYLSLQIGNVHPIHGRLIDDVTAPHISKGSLARLRFVRLGGWATQLFRSPLQAIVTLHLEKGLRTATILYSTFRTIITSSPGLENLSVSGDIIPEDSWPGTSDVIVLPKLRALRMCGVAGNLYPGLLLGIDAPLLRSLTLANLLIQDLDRVCDNNNHARYSNLSHLVFEECDLCLPEYRRVFGIFRNITSFSVNRTVNKTPITNILQDGFTELGDSLRFHPWPGLCEIGFLFSDTVEEEDSICKVIENRRRFGYPISKVLLRVPEGDLNEMDEIETNDSTKCEFITRTSNWPPGISDIDDGDTIYCD